MLSIFISIAKCIICRVHLFMWHTLDHSKSIRRTLDTFGSRSFHTRTTLTRRTLNCVNAWRHWRAVVANFFFIFSFFSYVFCCFCCRNALPIGRHHMEIDTRPNKREMLFSFLCCFVQGKYTNYGNNKWEKKEKRRERMCTKNDVILHVTRSVANDFSINSMNVAVTISFLFDSS